MTIVLRRFENDTGEIAYIEQEKYCKAFHVCILKPISNDGKCMVLYQNDFINMENAKRTIKRRFPGMKEVK